MIRDLLASSPDAIHPVTREITIAGARLSAADTFAALYRLQALRKVAERAFADIDALVLPTAPTAYSTAQVLANPIELNSRLGTYTNFVNLLDLCGLALPAAMRADGIPFGITLLAPAGQDAQLASIGRVFHADTRLADGRAKPAAAAAGGAARRRSRGDEIAIAVVGAHLSGMALNGELKALGGRLLEAASTAPDYKLYALGTTPPKPGMLRVAAGTGSSIDRRSLGAVGGQRSENSSPRSRRRCRSAPCALPTAAASRDFWSRPPMSAARAIFPRSAAGARSWRRRRRCSALAPRLRGEGRVRGCLNEHDSRMVPLTRIASQSDLSRKRGEVKTTPTPRKPRTRRAPVRYARASRPRRRRGRRA